MSFLPGWFPSPSQRKIEVLRLGSTTMGINPAEPVHVWSGTPIAAKDYARVVCVCIVAARSLTTSFSGLSSCTIAGVSATIGGQCELTANISQNRSGFIAFAYATISAGASGNVTVVVNPYANQVIIHAFEVSGSTGVASILTYPTRSQTHVMSRNVPAGSAVIGLGGTTSTSASVTGSSWSGLGNAFETQYPSPFSTQRCTLSTAFQQDLPAASPKIISTTVSNFPDVVAHQAISALFIL